MILLLNQNEMNMKAADIIAETYHMQYIYQFNQLKKPMNSVTDSCVIVDLYDENQLANNKISALQLANTLIDAGLPATVNHIFLLVSEVSAEHPLSVYAHQLAHHFLIKYQRDVFTHIVSLLDYDMTIITLSEQNTWQVYGMTKEDLPLEKNCFTADLLPIISDKQLIWEGNQIFDFMMSPQHTLNGITYAWG